MGGFASLLSDSSAAARSSTDVGIRSGSQPVSAGAVHAVVLKQEGNKVYAAAFGFLFAGTRSTGWR